MKRLIQWPVLCGLSGLLLVQTVPAGQDYYVNNAVVPDAPNIDATNFVNNNSFTSGASVPYETTDTLNYTNIGTMFGDGGFQFDTLSSGFRSMASSFYNPGSITVPTSNTSDGVNIITFSGPLTVTATNIVNPGTLDEGADGLIQLTGINVDLAYATLISEQAAFNPPGTGSFGTDTNSDWDPSLNLTATSATSSEPVQNVFTASALFGGSYATYYNSVLQGTNLDIIRTIFLGNVNTNNVTTQAYFGSTSIGGGFATVEWSGVFTNPVTGLPATNYLYLNNDYVLGASTNVTFNNGVPSNFAFSDVFDPALTAPPPPPVPPNIFFSGVITNPYSYALVQVVPTSVAPGPTAQNPSGALTNLPARIQISAGRELNLALSTITGQNYLSLTSSNQFDGSAGAQIVSPYSDINLGVTNGFLTVSNLLQSVIPAWSGTIQVWSTEFFYSDTNSGSTVTNDYRVLIVSSSLVPFSTPQVQDLTLHGTNLVISDVFNISRNLSIDAQSLTLTANVGYPTNGAGSPDGELNFESGAPLFATALPNLLWLTNNGTITLANDGIFGGPSPANYQTFINRGLLSDQGSRIYAGYFQNSGTIQNGSGNFLLQSQSVVLTNGLITATGDIAITTGSLVASNVVVSAGRSLTLQVTNLLTDDGATNNWSVGASSLVGLNLPVLPASGDLLGTTISVLAAASKNVVNTWAGADRGLTSAGYLNNASLGGLILNASAVPPHSLFTFNPAGGSNAMYVVNLFLTNTAATFNSSVSNVTSLSISPGMVIYYQQAYSNGVPVSGIINGWNNNQLRWVSSNDLAEASIVLEQPSDPPGSFNFSVNGVQFPSGLATGPNYKVIIQAATNLVSPAWVNVYTGAPPFTFNNFGFTTNRQQFYRAKQGW